MIFKTCCRAYCSGIEKMRTKQQNLPLGPLVPAKKVERPRREAAPAVPQKATPANRRCRGPAPSRLPDGSRFDVHYDAQLESWSGTLQVPGHPQVRLEWRTLFGLISKLDARHRAKAKAGTEGVDQDAN